MKKKSSLKRCWQCKQVRLCSYGPDPYREDILEDDKPVWECEDCRQNSREDI